VTLEENHQHLHCASTRDANALHDADTRLEEKNEEKDEEVE